MKVKIQKFLSDKVDATKNVLAKAKGFLPKSNTFSNKAITTASPVAPQNSEDDEALLLVETEGLAGRVKNVQMEFWAVAGPFIIWLITGYAEGYLFSGFKSISLLDPASFLGYGTGFTLAAFTLNAIIKSSQYYHAKRYKACAVMVMVALMLATGSIVAQYVTLETQAMTGRLDIPDSMIEHIPLFNFMIGVAGLRGHDWLFLFRSGLLLIGEFVAMYAMPVKKQDIQATIEARREKRRALAQLRYDNRIEKIETAIWQSATATIEQALQPVVAQPSVTPLPPTATIVTPVPQHEMAFPSLQAPSVTPPPSALKHTTFDSQGQASVSSSPVTPIDISSLFASPDEDNKPVSSPALPKRVTLKR